MKFRFCGELDAPDWILKEITVLIKITSVRFRVLCAQVINQLLGGALDYEKVTNLLTKDSNIEYALQLRQRTDQSDVKAAIAALQFIVSNAAKYNTDDSSLSSELQQLGLPKEHCDLLSKPYRENKDKLRAHFAQQTLQQSVDWRVDYLLSSASLAELNVPTIQLKLNIKSPDATQSKAFEVTSEKFRVLLLELKAAKELMDAVS